MYVVDDGERWCEKSCDWKKMIAISFAVVIGLPTIERNLIELYNFESGSPDKISAAVRNIRRDAQ